MNSLHFIRAAAGGADGEQAAAAGMVHPARLRGKLPLGFGGTVNWETDVFSPWFYKNYIKTLDRCEKRVEAQGVSFCQGNSSQSSLVLGVWVRAHLSQRELFPGFQWALEEAGD